MNPSELCLLALCLPFDNTVKPLSGAEFQDMQARVIGRGNNILDRELTGADFKELGYTLPQSERFIALLSRQDKLAAMLEKAENRGIKALTRISAAYPKKLTVKLGGGAPLFMFYSGDIRLFEMRGVTLVGCRKISDAGAAFAAAVGTLAAKHGLVLISGGAAGADTIAQDAALKAGGSVISLAARGISGMDFSRDRLLLASCVCPEEGFRSGSAHLRNRYLHALGEITLVAQSGENSGGTWAGSMENLKKRLSPLYVSDIATGGSRDLIKFGAVPINQENLEALFAQLKQS